MDLKLFFDPVEAEVVGQNRSSSSFQEAIYVNHEIMYDLDGIDIVLIGLSEYRGSESQSTGLAESSKEVRKKLYNLKPGAGTNRILDLGNLRNGPTVADTYLRIKEICGYLLDRNILPILFGGSQDLNLGQYFAYESLEKLVTVLNIDSEMDLEDETTNDKSHLSSIFKHHPNYLFSFHQLAYQSYLVDPKHYELLEKLYFNSIRLGVVKESIQEMEPVIRDADMLTFDISAIQSHYCPGSTRGLVYGLTGEEACQLCWYAGLSDKLSSVGFYEYDVDRDSEARQTATVIATMIWYFIEGFYHRKGDKNFMSNDFLVYEVALGDNPSSIRFYKSKRSEKWWMEVPGHASERSVFLRNNMIPCSYADYELALTGEIPERWINAHAKLG
ncbi:MAG: formimidoylglutamase [Cyclobacteriaceae bacterium]|nr:formimidoylglutamase [Cyclobacteriaceae bacterium HetDA_MAG_MS6]